MWFIEKKECLRHLKIANFISYFSVAVKNCADKSNLMKKGLSLSSERDRVHHGNKGMETVRESIASGVESWLITFSYTHTHT